MRIISMKVALSSVLM